jgi:hypothetical protein
MNGGLSLKERGLKLAAKVSNSGAKVYLLYRVRELFKKIQKINEKEEYSIDEKDMEIVNLLGEIEDGQTKPNIELFGPKPYLVDKDLTFDKDETEVSILNYLPQFKTNCLETIGKVKLDKKMTETIAYLSKDENRRVVALIATEIDKEYPGLAGFTPDKVYEISYVCDQKKGDGSTHDQIEKLEMNLLIGAKIYEGVKSADKEQERKNSKDSSAGGKRKTKRKRRKSKKSSRKKRKTRRSKK